MYCKCRFPAGVSIKPDGKNRLDPCIYQDIEKHTNVNIVISRCMNCGNIEISWTRTSETEDFDLTKTETGEDE